MAIFLPLVVGNKGRSVEHKDDELRVKSHEVARSGGVTQMDQADLCSPGGPRAILCWPQTHEEQAVGWLLLSCLLLLGSCGCWAALRLRALPPELFKPCLGGLPNLGHVVLGAWDCKCNQCCTGFCSSAPSSFSLKDSHEYPRAVPSHQ